MNERIREDRARIHTTWARENNLDFSRKPKLEPVATSSSQQTLTNMFAKSKRKRDDQEDEDVHETSLSHGPLYQQLTGQQLPSSVHDAQTDCRVLSDAFWGYAKSDINRFVRIASTRILV